MLERRVVPPWGVFGGKDGLPDRISLTRDGVVRDIKGKETLNGGDVVVIERCGGGGYGDPAKRAVELIAHDQREGDRASA